MKDSIRQAWILSKLRKNYEIECFENTWKYEISCSSEYSSFITKILLSICKEPFKEQIANVIEAIARTNNEDLNIQGTAELYWGKFMMSLRLPNMVVVPVGNQNDGKNSILENLVLNQEKSIVNREKAIDNSRVDTWDLVLEHLRLFEMDPAYLLQTMETDLPKSEDKELVRKMLCRSFQLMADFISDYALHDTYKTIVNRLTEIAEEKQDSAISQYLSHILEAEGYKLDEIEVIAYFLEILCKDENFARDFFRVQGSLLPRLLSEALDLLSKFKKWDAIN